jgi:uncharacterized protein (TIGR02594 family)
MSSIPAQYAYLRAEPRAPLMVQAGLDLYGLHEIAGTASNPTILAWADEVGKATKSAYADWAADYYNADAIPWCGLFVALCAVRAAQGRPERLPEHKYLSALDWKNWGLPVLVKDALVGDVGISQRDGGGHVFMIVGEDPTHFHTLGGNQSDAVTITRIGTDRLHAVRWPAGLARRKSGFLTPRLTAGLSGNEA